MNIELSIQSEVSLKKKNTILKDAWTPVFIAALFTIARTWKQPRCPLKDEWIKKMWYIYMTEYYCIYNAVCSKWMDPEIIKLSQAKTKTI